MILVSRLVLFWTPLVKEKLTRRPEGEIET